MLFVRLALAALLALFADRSIALAQPPPPAQSTITVDFTKIQRVIPVFLFGQNLQTIARGEGIIAPDGSVDGSIISLLSEVKITMLRFPGGTPADYFHWWQALSPQSHRASQLTGYPNESYQPVVGPDEFVQISIALRAVPFVTANVGTGTPDEAAAWANFFNSRGFPVVYWEIGNEIYFQSVLPNGLAGLPPDVYAQKLIQYATAIRKQAPDAKILAAAVIGPEEQNSFWNTVVLGLVGPYIDGISVHNAYYPLYGYLPDKSVPSDEYLYTAMLGATAAVERTTSVLEDQLKSLGKLIPMFVTEYDGIFLPDATIEDPAVTAARNPTLASALFNASVLQILARHQRVYGAHHMSLAGSLYGSLIGVDAGGKFRNPQFYVHREYAREVGNLLMQATVDPQTGVFNSGPIYLLSGQQNVPMLDAMAARDPGGQTYSLFVVNRSLTQTVNTSVTLTLPTGVTGTVSVLTGPTYSSRNDSANPNRVSMTTTGFSATSSFSYSFPPYSLTIFRWKR